MNYKPFGLDTATGLTHPKLIFMWKFIVIEKPNTSYFNFIFSLKHFLIDPERRTVSFLYRLNTDI